MLNKPCFSISPSAVCLLLLPQFLRFPQHFGALAGKPTTELASCAIVVGEPGEATVAGLGDRWIVRTGHFCRIQTLTRAVALAHTASRTDSEGEWKQVPGKDGRLLSAPGTSAQVRNHHTAEGETDHLSVTKGSLRSGFAPYDPEACHFWCVCV